MILKIRQGRYYKEYLYGLRDIRDGSVFVGWFNFWQPGEGLISRATYTVYDIITNEEYRVEGRWLRGPLSAIEMLGCQSNFDLAH